jgi:hypothetical protein
LIELNHLSLQRFHIYSTGETEEQSLVRSDDKFDCVQRISLLERSNTNCLCDENKSLYTQSLLIDDDGDDDLQR